MKAGEKGIKYNKTQLNPQEAFDRHIYHRDQFAHYLRWSHVLKNAKIGQTILDFGCGTGEMLELFYRNKYRPRKYLGLDVRQKTIDDNLHKFANLDFADFKAIDLCEPDLDLGEAFDVITSFEVIEHIGHENIDAFLENIWGHCDDNTVVYISTPNYDPQVGAAANHTLTKDDGTTEIGEWDHFELQEKLSKYFIIEQKYGTFASIKDYKEDLTGWRKEAFEELRKYYDTNLLSNMMAPMMPPEHARNCLWVLRAKEEI